MKSCLESFPSPVAPDSHRITAKSHSLDLSSRPELELWGGIECTLNRVGDRYLNQCEWSGHLQRPGDLDLLADLQLRALRYPVLWEMLAPESLERINWDFPDERLIRLRELGIRPIIDLVHHGSGPRYAPIDSPHFAPGVARFAAEVARRYPWIEAYTPINEPLTTARFAGRYGVWYPHGNDDTSFLRVLLNECRATVLAMRAVREVNPRAQLIQTEDLGYIYCVPELQLEADFQNHRRWLGFDLLCGRVVPGHPLWGYLLSHGIEAEEMCWFAENPCPPDVIGINYYPTSDRFLGADTDFEAVRVMETPLEGFAGRLREVWERYRLPLAITEAHLGCTREEQMRWFNKAWQAARELRTEGVDIRAVTAWALLGSHNWNSLVTRDEGYYEPGVFDLRGPKPRATALAPLLRALAAGGDGTHPLLGLPGWWERPMRLLEPKQVEPGWGWQGAGQGENSGQPAPPRPHHTSIAPLLILGASGTLGSAFIRACEMRAIPYHALSGRDLDLRNPDAVEATFEQIRPWAVVNATGARHTDNATYHFEDCYSINTESAVRVAQSCLKYDAALLCFSSDQVFDGAQRSPYLESVAPAPLNSYGRSKAAMETQISTLFPRALIVRTSCCFGPWDSSNFVTQTLRALGRNEPVKVPEDVVISPTYVPDLVNMTLDLLIDRESGVWHLTNIGEINWLEFVRQAARLCGLKPDLVRGHSHHELQPLVRRPLYSALGSERGFLLPTLEASLLRYTRRYTREAA